MTPEDVREAVGKLPRLPLMPGRWITELIVEERLARILEVGTLHGVSACYLAAAAAQVGGRATTVDLPRAADKDPPAEELRRRCRLEKSLEIVRCDGGGQEWMRQALLDGLEFDLIYLDADHSFLPTLALFALAGALVRAGGYVLMDDIEHPEILDSEEAWQSVCLRSPGWRRIETPVWNWGLLQRIQ